MFCFKKKKFKKRTKCIQYRTEMFKVGKTNIQLKLKDGREFIQVVEGHITQYREYGNDESMQYSNVIYPINEPIVSDKIDIINSLWQATQKINNYSKFEDKIYLTPDHMVLGQIVEAKILDTDENYEKEQAVAFITNVSRT